MIVFFFPWARSLSDRDLGKLGVFPRNISNISVILFTQTWLSWEGLSLMTLPSAEALVLVTCPCSGLLGVAVGGCPPRPLGLILEISSLTPNRTAGPTYHPLALPRNAFSSIIFPISSPALQLLTSCHEGVERFLQVMEIIIFFCVYNLPFYYLIALNIQKPFFLLTSRCIFGIFFQNASPSFIKHKKMNCKTPETCLGAFML